MYRILLIILALAITGCAVNESASEYEFSAPQADPRKVPESFTLYDPVPVLAVKFEASKDGYRMAPFRAMGAPTSTIDQGRDVLIQVFDSQGEMLSSVSIDNPREIHTAGSTKPDRATLPKATFTLFFANPDSIQTLNVSVLDGPNREFIETYKIDPRELKFLDTD